MEILVSRDSRIRVSLRTIHRLKRSHDPRQIVGIGSLRRKRRRCGLNDGPRLLEGQKQVPIEALISSQPAKEFLIEQAPIMPGLHMRPEPRPDADQSLRGQYLDRLPHNTAAGAKSRFQFMLRRKGLTRQKGATHDLSP